MRACVCTNDILGHCNYVHINHCSSIFFLLVSTWCSSFRWPSTTMPAPLLDLTFSYIWMFKPFLKVHNFLLFHFSFSYAMFIFHFCNINQLQVLSCQRNGLPPSPVPTKILAYYSWNTCMFFEFLLVNALVNSLLVIFYVYDSLSVFFFFNVDMLRTMTF